MDGNKNGERRGRQRARREASARLGVEALESRNLLSASTGMPPAGFYGMALPRVDGAPHNSDVVWHLTGDDVPARAAAIRSDGGPSEEPHGATGGSGGAYHFEQQVVVHFMRLGAQAPTVAPTGVLSATAPGGGATALDRGFSETPGANGNRVVSGAPLAANAPGGGEPTQSASLLVNALAPRIDPTTAWVAATASASSQASSDGKSPLLRALESRDAVFRALSTQSALRSSDIAKSLNGEASDAGDATGRRRVANEEAGGYVELFNADELQGETLRDATDAEADATGAILTRLERPAIHRGQRASRDAADEQATDAMSADASRLLAINAAQAAVQEGGMVLLRANGAPEGADGIPAAEGTDSAGDPFKVIVDMDAAFGVYQAFGVGSDEAPAITLPAAIAKAATAGGSASALEKTSAAEMTSAAPAGDRTAYQGLAVGAGIVSLGAVAARMRPQPENREDRERRRLR